MTPVPPVAPKQKPLRQVIQDLGTVFAYAYLLRVPLLIGIGLAALPFIALPRDAAAGSLLRGLFDIVDRDPTVPEFIPLFTFGVLTLASLMLAASIAITARLILLDCSERCAVRPLPPSSGIQLMIRLLPLTAAVSLVTGAWTASWPNFLGIGPAVAAVAGTVVGVWLFVWMMTDFHDRLWNAVFSNKKTVLTTNFVIVAVAKTVFAAFRWVVRLTPDGFVNAAGRIRARHAFALLQFLLSIGLYAGLFLFKWDWDVPGGVPRIPTLCLVINLAMLLCWTLSGLTFLFDRCRVPLLTVLFVYGSIMSAFTWNDHFFQTVPHQKSPIASAPASVVLKQRAGRPAVVIAAAGGGIQAAAWTARVIAGIHQDSKRCGEDFDDALVAISGVSGGSVGAMYIVDAFERGQLTDGALQTAVKAAEASSLDEVAWGLTYPDFAWSVFPFLKGVYRPLLVTDRGSALEDAWKRTPSLPDATLDEWRADLVANPRVRPAVLFNATVAETGQRMLLGTTTLGTGLHDPGRREFTIDFPDLDVPVVTAARLSATFPYVSPAARINVYGGFDNQYHYVDGGYYDNYGTATLVEWLDQGLSTLGADMPSRVLILQIRSFADGDPPAPNGARGWTANTLQPLETLYEVRGAGQMASSDMSSHLFQDDYGDALITNLKIGFPARFADDRYDQSPPLSWHLTPDDRGRLERAWNDADVYHAREQVQAFMRGTETPSASSCLVP